MLKNTKIVIKNDLELIEPVKKFLVSIAEKTGLNSKEINRINYALEDVLQNSILYDFDSDEEEEITIEFIPVTSGLKVILSDHGQPRDPKLVEHLTMKQLIEEIDADSQTSNKFDEISSISTFIIHKLLDSYTFFNKGKDGRALEMLVYASETRVNTKAYPSPETIHAVDETFSKIRKATPDDALGISRLFYKCYGYSYPYSLIYYPERLAEAIEKKEISNTIALSDKNNIIAHLGLKPPYSNAKVTEWGMAICDPKFRGQGIMNKIVDTIKEDSFISNYKGIFAHAVTNHEFTQKVCDAHNFSETALLVGYAGNDLSFKKIHKKLQQRESVFISYKIISPPENLNIFFPPQHKEMICKLYDGIGLQIKQAKNVIDSIPDRSIVKESVVSSVNIAELVIEQSGKDLVKIIENTTRRLCINKLDVIYLIINLQDSAAIENIKYFEKFGYVFSGLFPYFYNEHSLILQYFNNLTFDFELIKTHTPLAAELKDYIKKH